jgi:hypothetical protein
MVRRDRLLALAAVTLVLVLPSCDLGRPWPEPPPALHSQHSLLMIGDSLVGQTDTELPTAFDRAGLNVEVIDAHANASGLLGPVGDEPSALAWVQEQVAEHPEAGTVVVEWGGACGIACDPTEPAFVQYGSPDFYAQWTANAHAIIDWLRAQGKLVVWVVTPPFGVDVAGGATSQLRVDVALELADLDRTDFAVRAGGTIVDWSAALTNLLSEFRTALQYDGSLHTVRTPDLVHLTSDGATRTSVWTVKAVADLWAANPGVTSAGVASASRVVEAGDPVTIDVPPGL